MSIPVSGLELLENVQLEAQRTALYHVEVIGGKAIEKPLPKYLHQIIQRRIVRLLEAFYGERVVEQLDFSVGGALRVPDIVVLAPDTKFVRGIVVTPPLLCVEILSPGQQPEDLFEKCEAYLAAGVPECWVFVPKLRTQGVYRVYPNAERVTESTRLDHGPVAISVPTLFENLPNDIE
ncbi:MAG TPA: Uma2 family endonuclease [Bryobacteraceae bacterium]|jgi:Uma2 family endonuclease|nr:Uma2 family endonuclease [Bryobacteraceae bacterium]